MITNTTTDASSSTSTPSMTAPAPKFVSHSNKFNFFPTKVLVNNLTTTSTRMIADSGCSNHYVMLNRDSPGLGGTFCDIGGYNFHFLWIDIKTY